MKQPEHIEQCALIRWAAYNQKKYPELELLFAIPNGGARHPATAVKLKAEGVKAGMPDLCLPVQRGIYIGLWIEMKFGRNKPTKQQIECHMRLMHHGHRVVVCYSWTAAVDAIIDYLIGKPTVDLRAAA